MEDNNKDNKNNKAPQWGATLLVLLTGVMLGLLLAPSRYQRPATSKLDRTLSYIERHYVDRLGGDTLVERMITAMLADLDPHSHYLSPREKEREDVEMAGRFYGIGALLLKTGDTTCIFQVTPGGPAQRAGLRCGDRILQVDTLGVVGQKPSDIVKLLRGRRGTRLTVTVLRPGEEAPRTALIVRDNIDLPSISCHCMLDAQTGYIRLDRFCETSADEFRRAVADLRKEHTLGRLVLDLRDNGGGLLEAVVGIADELLPGNEMIVYTEGAHQRRRELRSTPGGCFAEGPLIVMVNEYSASCSEILAGTVQDNDRGLIVGRRTFGKGLVQREFPLRDGSSVFLTTSRYYTPSGRCIQRPYDKGNDEYYADFLRRVFLDLVSDEALFRPTDTTRYFTASGRVVYAGGGILPDRPIRPATDSLYRYFNELVDRRIIDNYAFEYAVRHQDDLLRLYPTEEDFILRFEASQAMLSELVARGQEAGIRPNPRTLARHGLELRRRIKATIAEALYSTEALHRVLLTDDSEIRDALAGFASYPL